MNKLRELTYTLTNSKEVQAKQLELSIKYGGAWTYDVLPFTTTVLFAQFKSPSNVPDSYFDICHNQIGYKGQIVPFTDAAQYREHQRGYSGDR